MPGPSAEGGAALRNRLQDRARPVPDTEVRQFLADAGCHLYQGFLYQSALSAEHFTQYARGIH